MIPEPGFQKPRPYCAIATSDKLVQWGKGMTHFGGGRCQEIIHFLVNVDGTRQILDTTHLSLDQVVTVDSRGDSSSVHTRRHELQERHLYYISRLSDRDTQARRTWAVAS
jgi:hypothetical protein